MDPWGYSKDFLLLSYGLFLATVYWIREPYFVYPVTALMLTTMWEALGWNGSASVATLIAVWSGVGAAALSRRIQRRPFLSRTSQNEVEAVIITIAGFALMFAIVAVPFAIAFQG